MAKVKEITVGGSYTYQAAPYHPVKGEAHVTVAIDEGDDMETVRKDVEVLVTDTIVSILAGVNVIHDKLVNKGVSVDDLADELEESEEGEWEDPREPSDEEEWDI